jgi:signal recognition particle receptor subunit beta
VELDFAARALTIKLVYYGPALSGKTTNLRALHDLVAPEARGRLMALDTRDDRTLFFDLLPLRFRARSGVSVCLKLFTVPGQVIHNATRRLVLAGVDGVAFIADSRSSAAREAAMSFVNLRQNLADNGLDIEQLPVVIQFNKRDLPDIRSDAELDDLAARGREPVFKAVATRGDGVLATFFGLVRATCKKLEQKHGLSHKFQLDEDALIENLAARIGPTSLRSEGAP